MINKKTILVFGLLIGVVLIPKLVYGQNVLPVDIENQMRSLMESLRAIMFQLHTSGAPVVQNDNPNIPVLPLLPKCGDLNGDALVNSIDLDLLKSHVENKKFVSNSVITDLNGDQVTNILDFEFLQNFISTGEHEPNCMGGTFDFLKPLRSKLVLGERVAAQDFLKVRVLPGGLRIASVLPFEQGVVIENAQFFDGRWWAKILWDNQLIGFSAEDYLVSRSNNFILEDQKESVPVNVPHITRCGDLNEDSVVNIIDFQIFSKQLLLPATVFSFDNADLDGDKKIDQIDLNLLDQYLKKEISAPTCSLGTLNYVPKINLIPVVSPIILVNQLNIFKWAAMDQDNDLLNWHVTWGDGKSSFCDSKISLVCNNYSFSAGHAWDRPGVFVILAIVSDGRGGESSHSFVVEIKEN